MVSINVYCPPYNLLTNRHLPGHCTTVEADQYWYHRLWIDVHTVVDGPYSCPKGLLHLLQSMRLAKLRKPHSLHVQSPAGYLINAMLYQTYKVSVSCKYFPGLNIW